MVDAFHRALEREALTLRSRIDTTAQLAELIGAADLSQLSDDELEALIAQLDGERGDRPSSLLPPDADERSRRAAALLEETGAIRVTPSESGVDAHNGNRDRSGNDRR